MKRLLFVLMILVAGLSFAGQMYFQHCDAVSQKNLISSSLGRWSDGTFQFQAQGPGDVDTVRVGAVLVAFQPDLDDRTTGSGEFDLSVSDTAVIDPPPHNSLYFEQQLQALKNYYMHVSGGQLVLETTVVPEVFILPDSMAVYNPATTEEETDKGLVMLVRDAVVLADEAGYSLSGYESLIVFHAGVGKDIDLGGYDPTPSDIPSAFLNLDDFRSVLAAGDPNYEGIPVMGGDCLVTEAIVLPETENQLDYEVGLLGTTALMFGFQLGLPALWHTGYGRTGIGRWGLMDQGSGNFNGLIPAEPCAWSKVFLGWEAPVIITEGEDLSVACVRAETEPKIYKVPINDHEYFLIENRQYDANGDSVAIGQTASGAEVIFLSNGQIAISEKGVIVSVDDYDYGLPGSGILIWHIDETVIAAGMHSNTVNNDMDHRGVDLEEADGAQDIGYSYGMISGGAGSENGILYDAWFAGNEAHFIANESEVVQFTPYTCPNSRAYDGANSHIRIHNFSERDTVMTFRVSNDLVMPGYPVDVGEGENLFPPTCGDLDGDGEQEVVVVSKSGKLFVWKYNKTPLVEPGVGQRRLLNGEVQPFEIPLFGNVVQAVDIAPVVGDLNRDGKDEVYVSTGPEVSGWQLAGSQSQNYLTVAVQGDVTASLIADNALFVGTSNGGIYRIESDGVFQEIVTLDQAIGDLALSSLSELVAASGNQIVLLTADGNLVDDAEISNIELIRHLVTGSIRTDSPVIVGAGHDVFVFDPSSGVAEFIDSDARNVPLSLGDVNGDGLKDILFSKNGKIVALQANGSMVDNFPKPAYERNTRLSQPLIADLDGDGRPEVIVSTTIGTLEAYDASGQMADGFPLSTGDTTATTPLVADLDGDGDAELMASTADGLCFGWDLAGQATALVWGSEKRNPQRTAMNKDVLTQKEPGADWMPEHLVYNYPNPSQGDATTIRYRLEADASVQIKIYNLSGHLVYETDAPGEGMIDHDVHWDISDMDSGVYFCQVRAKRNGEENVVTIKIAVVR